MQAGRFCLFVLCLALAQVAAAQLLSNPGFEGSYTTTAPGWSQITYGSPSFPSVLYSKETGNVHSGAAAQKIVVNNLGDGATLLIQPYDFPAGKIYEGSVWLRADDTMKIVFMFQERVPDYYVPAVIVKDVHPGWQQLIIRGGYSRNVINDQTLVQGRFVIQPLEPGTLYIDDASLRDITDSVLNGPVANTSEVPDSYFGMHINKLGVHQTYPPTSPGMIRLWNTGTEWKHIEPYSGALLDSLNWVYDPNNVFGAGFRLDYYVNFIRSHDTTAGILYTMGQTPSWSASSPAAPPGSLADWQNYVSIVGNRYKHKIRYWEPWNEVDFSSSWSGTNGQLRDLAESAYQTLKNIDPGNQVLTPNVAGAENLAHYLYEGGAAYADIVSWHHYPCRRPEEMIPEIIGMKSLMGNYGVSSKPLWNTEGAISIPAFGNFDPGEDLAAVSRTLLLQWTYGIANYNWYAWDIYYSSNCDYARLSASLNPNQYDSLTATGKAYVQTESWLKGAQVVSKQVTGDTWMIGLERSGGYKAWVVWNVSGTQNFVVPSAWNIQQVRDLYGLTTAFSGSSMQIDQRPLLVENGASTGISTPLPADEIYVFPNPFKDRINIRLPNRSFHHGSLTLRSITGEVVQRTWFDRGQNSAQAAMEPGDIPPGIYLLDLQLDSWRKLYKLTKEQ